MGVYGLPGTVKIWHFELTQDHLDTDVTEGMRRSLGFFLFATPTIWVSMDSPGHQQSRFGIFSWLKTTWTLMTPRSLLFCSKSQQYGCLQTPLDPRSRFGILSWLRTTWKLRTLRVCEGYFAFLVPNPYNMGVYRLHWSQAIKIWHFELYQDNLDTEDSKGMQRSLCLFVPNPYNGCNCLWTPLNPSSQDSAFWADLR